MSESLVCSCKCRAKDIFVESNKLDILFRAKRKIKEDEEIVWDYGSNFSGVNNCVSSCIKCLKKSKIMEIMKSKLYIILNIKL